jgi:hypothetical protein
MRRSNFALRLQPSLLAEARKVAEAEGGRAQSADQCRLSREAVGAAHGELFRRAGGERHYPEALRILDRAGVGQPPVGGDELPDKAPKRRSPPRGPAAS